MTKAAQITVSQLFADLSRYAAECERLQSLLDNEKRIVKESEDSQTLEISAYRREIQRLKAALERATKRTEAPKYEKSRYVDSQTLEVSAYRYEACINKAVESRCYKEAQRLVGIHLDLDLQDTEDYINGLPDEVSGESKEFPTGIPLDDEDIDQLYRAGIVILVNPVEHTGPSLDSTALACKIAPPCSFLSQEELTPVPSLSAPLKIEMALSEEDVPF